MDGMSEFSILQDLLAMTGEMAPYPQMSPAVVADMPLADQLGETLATLVDVERSCNLTDLDATTISGQNHAILDMEPTTFSGNETGHFGGYQAAGYMTEFEDVSEPSASPAPSIASSNGGSFSFPPQAPTPEAALPLEECLAQCPSMDTSLFFKQEVTEEKVRDMEKETSTTAKALAAHIKKRRKASGLEEVPSRNKDDKREANELTRADFIRRERRRASNRRAATKCRMKKKAQEEQSKEELGGLQQENANLRAELEKLRSSKNELEQRFEQHLAICRHVHR